MIIRGFRGTSGGYNCATCTHTPPQAKITESEGATVCHTMTLKPVIKRTPPDHCLPRGCVGDYHGPIGLLILLDKVLDTQP